MASLVQSGKRIQPVVREGHTAWHELSVPPAWLHQLLAGVRNEAQRFTALSAVGVRVS